MNRRLVEMHAEAVAQGRQLVFTIPMQRVTRLFGFASMTCSSDPFDRVEAVIDESRYKVADNYKMSLRATNPDYGVEHFYIMDLESLMTQYPEDYTVEVRDLVASA